LPEYPNLTILNCNFNDRFTVTELPSYPRLHTIWHTGNFIFPRDKYPNLNLVNGEEYIEEFHGQLNEDYSDDDHRGWWDEDEEESEDEDEENASDIEEESEDEEEENASDIEEESEDED